MVYTWCIHAIYWYIHGIYMIYSDVSRKHMVTANLFRVCMYLYVIYIYYIHIIYQVYTRYIPGILSHMSWIYIVYHKDIIIKKGTEQTHEVWSRYIPGILVTWAYDWNIPGIYLVYNMHIPIFQLYTKNIHGIYHMVYPLYILEYTLFIHSICSGYTLYILGIYWYIFGIYNVYALICVYTPPGG